MPTMIPMRRFQKNVVKKMSSMSASSLYPEMRQKKCKSCGASSIKLYATTEIMAERVAFCTRRPVSNMTDGENRA